MMSFDFVNFIFCGTFGYLTLVQNPNGKRHPSMLMFVDFLDVIGRFSEMNPFLLSKSGFVREKLGKNIACSCMEYVFRGTLPNYAFACRDI